MALELGLERLTVKRHWEAMKSPWSRWLLKRGCRPDTQLFGTAEPKSAHPVVAAARVWTAAVTIAAQVGLGEAE